MPAATQYSLEPDNAIESAFEHEITQRGEAIARRWRYYDGAHDQPLRPQRDRYNDNVILNNIEPLSDRLVAFMLGDGVTFDAGGNNDATADDENVASLWAANRGDALLNTLAIAGVIEGHCAVRLQPVEGDWPRLTRIRQQHFAAFWDGLDLDRVLWYRLQHTSGNRGTRIDYVRGGYDGAGFNHNAPGWVEVVFELDGQSGGPLGVAPKWKRVGEPEPWLYDYPPVVDWQNIANPNGYYGKSDIVGAIRLNDALNFILSNLQRIIKHYASPKTIGLGFKASELVGTEVGGFFSVNKPPNEANIFNLEMQSDLQSSMQLADIITSGLWSSGGMVDPATLKDRIGQLTNFGLRVLYADAIKRIDKKRTLYGEAFDIISRAGLALAGLPVPDVVVTVWDDVLPQDETVQVETLTMELQNGIISKETYRDRRDYDNEKEMQRLADEATTNGNLGGSIINLLANNSQFNRGAV